MNEAENARMIRFSRWLCNKRNMSSWDVKNELDLLAQIVSRTGTKMVSAAAAPGYSRRCATKLIKQDVFRLFPDEYTLVCRVLEDFVAFAESEARIGASSPWSVQECLYVQKEQPTSENSNPFALGYVSYEKEVRIACRILEALSESFANADKETTDVKSIFRSIEKKIEAKKTSDYEEATISNICREAHLSQQDEVRYSKLKQKILQIFNEEDEGKKIHYIGEVPVNDTEYRLLLEFTRYQLQNHPVYSPGIDDSPLVATTLVQIGIRMYDGRYWPHVAQELGMEKISAVSQRFLNATFQNTARKHGFVVLADAEIDSRAIQSILFHGIVSNHYASSLFDLLFRYYDRDLDRNLEQNTPERMNMLLETLRQSETDEDAISVALSKAAGGTSKAYMLKRHTIAALTAFPEINSLRLRRYVEMIDAAFWYQQLPEKDSSRLTRCFCEWAMNSPDLKEQYRIRANKTGILQRKRYFQTPYLHADLKNGNFELCLPEQILRQFVEADSITWCIQGEGIQKTVPCETFEAVCGFKTEEIKIDIAPTAVLSEIVCSINIGENILNRFKISETCARFFDAEGNQVNTLSAGECVGFTAATERLRSAALLGDETVGEIHRWEFNFENGDVVIFPDATSCYIGGSYTEGLLRRGRVPSVYCEKLSISNLPVYNMAPEILLLIDEEKMEGTSLFVNDKRYRLTDCAYKNARDSNQNGRTWILISTSSFPNIKNNAVNRVAVELPGAAFVRKPLAFVLCEGLWVEFEDAPYIFEERGSIVFSPKVKVERAPGTDYHRSPEGNSFNFELAQPDGMLHFVLPDGNLPIAVDIPAFSWSADQKNWNLSELGDVWEKDFPYNFSLRGPFRKVRFDFGIDPGTMQGENAVALTFEKNTQTGLFSCDLTRARSWITRDKACYPVKLLLDGKSVQFGRIFAKSILLTDKIELIADFDHQKLTLLCDIIGSSKSYYADIRLKSSGKLLASKEPFDGKKLEIHCEIPNGEYEVTVFETDDDDFFDDTYYVLGTHSCTLLDRNNLSGKQIRLKYISRKLNGSFRLQLKGNLRICRLQRETPRVYRAELTDEEENAEALYRVQLILTDTEELNRFFIKYWDEKYEEYYEFDYDRTTNMLLTENEEQKSLPYNMRYRRYTTLFEDQDEFIGTFEEEHGLYEGDKE